MPSVGFGDTAVGRTLEAQLGIPINSRKTPDYKGIELKSFRGLPANRKTLFAQVPDWRASTVHSSADILVNFGYGRGLVEKLYVTVSAMAPNAQGLQLLVDDLHDRLLEVSTKPSVPVVAVWPFELLRQRLSDKHAETFWVEATGINRRRGSNMLLVSPGYPHADTDSESVGAADLVRRHYGRSSDQARKSTSVRKRAPIQNLSSGYRALVS